MKKTMKVRIKNSGFSSICLIFVMMIAFMPSSLLAAKQRLDPQKADSIANSTDNHLKAADAYSDAWLHQKAIDRLKMMDQNHAEVLWRLARSYVDIGENLEEKEAIRYYDMAKEAAEKAVELNPENPMAQQTLGVVCGRVALYKGILKAGKLVKQVHLHSLQAVALGDSMPVALYILGKTHKKLMEKSALKRKLGGLSWASDDSVSYYFDKALEVSAGNMTQCRVEYAEFLLKFNRKEEARKMLENALELPLRDEQDTKGKELAREMLKKI